MFQKLFLLFLVCVCTSGRNVNNFQEVVLDEELDPVERDEIKTVLVPAGLARDVDHESLVETDLADTESRRLRIALPETNHVLVAMSKTDFESPNSNTLVPPIVTELPSVGKREDSDEDGSDEDGSDEDKSSEEIEERQVSIQPRQVEVTLIPVGRRNHINAD